MPREFRQCWAYKDGNRCDLRAGHAGPHVRKNYWSDNECQGAPLIEVLSADEPAPFLSVGELAPAPAANKPAPSCVACHHYHSGECRCGCKEFIG